MYTLQLLRPWRLAQRGSSVHFGDNVDLACGQQAGEIDKVEKFVVGISVYIGSVGLCQQLNWLTVYV